MKRSIAGRGSDVPTQRRRSSILKTVRAPRTPLAELDTKPITPTDQTVGRRVSFSRRTGVAEFITHEATTTWKNVYEEHHNFTVDSFVNDSEGRPSGCPGSDGLATHHVGFIVGAKRGWHTRCGISGYPDKRGLQPLFQGEFQDVEAELDDVDEPPGLTSRDNHAYHATASINLTEQFAALETVSNYIKNPAAPVCHFEVSARTDNNFKPFGDEITDCIIGERSGVIEVDFSAVEAIQAADECDVNNSLDLKELYEAERNCAHTNSTTNLKSVSNSGPESGEADMSLTDTVIPPCLNPPAIPRSSCNMVPPISDWIADKENILLTPPQEINHSTVKTQEKVLVYDGKKLKYARIDDGLDDLEDPLPRKNENGEHVTNKRKDKLSAHGIASMSHQQPNTLIFDRDDVAANISITQCLPSTVKHYRKENKREEDNLENVDFIPGVSHLITNFKNNVTVLGDVADMSITRCAPTVEQGCLRSQNYLTTDIHTDTSISRCLPPGLRSSVITSLIGNKNANNISLNRHTTVFEKDNIEAEISMMQCNNGHLVINKETENGCHHKIQERSFKNRRTVLLEKDYVNADISVVKHVNKKIIEDKSIGKPQQNINNKRHTILFEQDNADMSVTECANIKIIQDKNVTKPEQDINNKRHTILFEKDNADMSVTECANIKIIQDKNITKPEQDINNKRHTILFEQDNADMSVTECANIKIIQDKNITKPEQNINNKRHTILFEQDNANMSVTECANIKIIQDKNITKPEQYINDKRHTILFEQDNADMSVTECAKIKIMQDKNIMKPEKHINKKRHTILFEQDNADTSVTECANTKIIQNNDIKKPEEDMNNKRHTILFEQDNADMSVTQSVNIKIIGDKNGTDSNQGVSTNNKRDTILFERDNANADMSVTQCAKIHITGNKNITNCNQNVNTHDERRTIVFEQDNMDADMSETQYANIQIIGDTNIMNFERDISTNNKMHTTFLEHDNTRADMSVTQCTSNIQIIEDKNITSLGQAIGANNRINEIVFEQDNIGTDMSVIQCANTQKILDKKITNPEHGTSTNNKRHTILFEKDDMDADMSVTQCVDRNLIDTKAIVEPKCNIDNGKRRTVLFEKDDINSNMSMTQCANIHILGVKNIVKLGEVDENNENTTLFKNHALDSDMRLIEDKSITSISLAKTDNGDSDNLKRATILLKKDDDFSTTHCANVCRIGDKNITYVTVAKADDVNKYDSKRAGLFEEDNITLPNVQPTKNPNIVCPSNTSNKEPIKGSYNDSLKFENYVIKDGLQYLNEMDTTKNGSLRKSNAFKREILETEHVPNDFKDQNEINTRKLEDELMNDFKHHNIEMPHNRLKKKSLTFEKKDKVSVSAYEVAKAKSFLEPMSHDHLNLSQCVGMSRYTLEVDKVSKTFNAFDINEPQALTVCAPVHVKYNPDRSSCSRLKTVHKIPTYDAELQTQNTENKHTSQDSISYSNVDAINSSKKLILSQLLDMSTNPLNANDGQELLEIEEEEEIEEETIPESGEDKSSQTTSVVEERNKSKKWSLRRSTKREVDLEPVSSLDSVSRTGTSDTSFSTSDDCADALAAKLGRFHNSKLEGRTMLNRRFESVISAVTEDPNDTAELLEALDHLTGPDSKSANKSRHLNMVDSGTTTDNADLSRRSVATNVNNELETSQKPRTEDSAIGSDIPDEWLCRRTLRFQDEFYASPAERDHERLSPLKKIHCSGTSLINSIPQKSKVIPGYLNEISDGVKELMSDLVKPMADMLPHTRVCAAPVPEHETHGEQADLAISSQVSSVHELELICPDHQSAEILPTPQESPNICTRPSNLRHDIAQAARRAVNRALHRHTSIEPLSIDISPKSSRSEEEEEILEPRLTSSPRVLTFDKENPLNNVLLRPYVPSKLPSPSSSAHDHNCINESREAIGPTDIHHCPKHGDRYSRKSMDIGCITVEYDMQRSNASRASATPPPTASAQMLSPSSETRIAELQDTEVNTLIAMKTSTQLLHAESDLTVADAGDSSLTVAYRCRTLPTETSESELNLPSRPLKRPHVAPVAATPSPRPPQKVHRRPTSPQTLMTSILNPSSPTGIACTSASPPSRKSSPKCSSQTNKMDKSSDKIGSFASSREHGPVCAPVYTAPVSPPGNLRAQVDALPFMGSRDCQWETAVTRAERGEAPKRGAWWWFRLLHSRLRLGIRIAHVAGASPEGDAVLAELVVTADLHGCRDPIVSLCVRLAAEAARAICAKESGATASRTPLLLQRLASLSRLAAQWGRAMHDARLSLALAVEEHGAVSFSVANVPLRCVWEVRMHVELSPPEESAKAPWPRAARVSARLASPGRATALTADELRSAFCEVPHNWGHVPATVWRVFRHLRSKTCYETSLGA